MLRFHPFSWSAGTDMAIDLGTANTCVYVKHRGIVLDEPSIVAMNLTTGRVEAVGHEAKQMLSRTPGNIAAIRPLQDGVIADFTIAEAMLAHFISRAKGSSLWARPRIVIGVPSNITQVERRAVKESAYRAKAREVYIVKESMAAAIGAGLPITEPRASMIVDIGGGTTDIAVISMAGLVQSRSIRVAGNELDDAIVQHVRKRHNLLVGDATAESIKIAIGSAFPIDHPCSLAVKGRHLLKGVPYAALLSSDEIREAVEPPVQVIVEAVKQTLEQAPPELAADLVDTGIVLAGGGALLKNLDRRLSAETGLPVYVADDPLSAVVRGVGSMLHDIDLLQRVATA